MPFEPLPPNPDLGKLKETAKRIRDLVRRGDERALDLVAEHHPRIDRRALDAGAAQQFSLTSAQLTLARLVRFDSWPKLKRYVELVQHLARSPHRQPIGEQLRTAADRADELVRLACLTYGSPDLTRPDEARRLLDREPALARTSIYTMTVAGDAGGVAASLSKDPAGANRSGGPFDWPPLLYACYSRLPDTDTLPVARMLLEAGADPNAGYLWDGLAPPFTALTGALGGGERGESPHPRSLELAAVLLAAGADANDSQAIYNRGPGDAPSDDTDFLELLLHHGFGQGDGGPWFRLLTPLLPTPTQLLGEAFQHAVEEGLARRARLLLQHGADPNGRGIHPKFGDRTAYQAAVAAGRPEIVALLERAPQ